MTKEEAIEIVKKVCSSVQADLLTHQKIQEAITKIEAELKAVVKP